MECLCAAVGDDEGTQVFYVDQSPLEFDVASATVFHFRLRSEITVSSHSLLTQATFTANSSETEWPTLTVLLDSTDLIG